MSRKRKLVIFGTGGHAKVIIDVVEREGTHEIACLVAEAKPPKGARLFGYPMFALGGETARLAGKSPRALIAIGDNVARMRVAATLKGKGWRFASAIHPGAAISREVHIGDGSVIMAGCVINASTRIGEHVIINTGASVDHDCDIGDGAHVAPGCHLCGGVSVGAGSFLGAGTIATPGVRIGKKVVTGAGASVVADVADAMKVAGVPAKPIS